MEMQKPRRGVILDRRGRVLAASNKIQSIFADPLIIKDPKEVSGHLQPILDMGAHEICALINESKNPRYVKIKAAADANECDAVAKIYGIGVESDWRRHYTIGPLASHIVGFTSGDNRGLAGIELKYEKQLAGNRGRNIFFADAARRPIRLKEQSEALTDGAGVILTIDAAIQQFVRAELLKQYEAFEAEAAVAIVAEPQTGAILAMVSLPDFDPNNFSSADPNDRRNRAVTDQFEPGSVLKPFIAAIALDAGVVTRTEKIYCEHGSYSGKGFGRIGEYGGHSFGNMTVKEILAQSSNIGMAKIGQKLGKDRLYNGLKLFGFGRKTGIDLPGEVPGLMWPPKKWTGYSVTRIPYGQEITVSAIQLLRAFCMLANGGRYIKPYVVSAIVDPQGEIVTLKRPPPQVGYVISPEVAKWITDEALVSVINDGTGYRAKLEKWQLFGKSGTANIAKTDARGYSETDYMASFLAGAPVENPKIAVLVSIRKPNRRLGKGYTGGTVASPVAAAIIEKTMNYLEKYN